jgi:excinuclease ABC subunit C
VSSGSLKEALRIMRRIFPWNDHSPKEIESSIKKGKSCFNHHIGLCPGTCIGLVKKNEYTRTTRNIILFLSGEKKKIKKNLEKEMKRASKSLEFEKAQKIKRQLFALDHIQDVAVISDDPLKIRNLEPKTSAKRIEGYDISNISGKNAVGSMVVFAGESPEKAAYRKFAIRGKNSPDDTGMLKEVLERRLNHAEWSLPDLILIDGGVGQVNAAKEILGNRGIHIPIIGMVKGRDRKGTDMIGTVPTWVRPDVLVRVRDEAHRFAVRYHRELRNRKFFSR